MTMKIYESIRAAMGLALLGSVTMNVAAAENRITHGPILGAPGATTMGVWARTERSGVMRVEYGLKEEQLDLVSEPVATELVHDNTGIVRLTGLKASRRYFYRVTVEGGAPSEVASFRTWPNAKSVRNEKYNPEGLFNFRFEFACGNSQGRVKGGKLEQPTYETLLRDHAGGLDFAILNGDWIYEEKRDFRLEEWMEQVGVAEAPDPLPLIPAIVGVWENYKIYLERGRALAAFHRRVPSFFTIDDHEILNDLAGSGMPGVRERRAVFRDVGAQAWVDYLAWSNPFDFPEEIYFGTGDLVKGESVLRVPMSRGIITSARKGCVRSTGASSSGRGPARFCGAVTCCRTRRLPWDECRISVSST